MVHQFAMVVIIFHKFTADTIIRFQFRLHRCLDVRLKFALLLSSGNSYLLMFGEKLKTDYEYDFLIM